jgi:hypothetical protein
MRDFFYFKSVERKMKTNLLILSIFLSIIIYANINYQHGINGMTLRDGGIGCICHDLTPTDTVNVWIEGLDTVFRGETARYRILITGGPAVAGGFNIASYFGELDTVDTLTQKILGELTQISPNLFKNDTVSWNFLYTAPDSLLVDTLYSVANSVNRDSIPSNLDQWNFGENFIVHVVDKPVYVQDKSIQPEKFILYQNYPNPFNPSTKIKFTISAAGTQRAVSVQLKVYDILGNEVANLVNEEKTEGSYEVEFNSNSGSAQNLSSGIYYYQIKAGSFIQTNKMLLMK